MNFKQLTSVVAAGVVAASMVMPSATIAAGFTPEYVDAHEWATTNGIIKKTSIEQAEMTTSTTKAMMAKMLVNFAEKYGFVDANSKISQAGDCKNFADIDYLKNQDLHEYVIKACEYGIM